MLFFNKKFPFIYFCFAAASVWILFSSSSGGSPGDYSGWQSPPSTCTTCHSGGTVEGSITLTGAPTSYTYGVTYNMTLTLSDPNALEGGFIISARSSTNAYIGTFLANLPANVKVVGGYSTHNSPKLMSAGSVSWPIQWKAPASGNSLVKFYWVGNAVSGNNDTADDSVYPDETTSFIPLPLELTDFTVEKSRSETLLKWRTAAEKNTAFFQIERSENGIDFKEIGKVTALNDFSKDNEYFFSDLETTENEQIFYRIQIFDLDGKSTFSGIKSIENLNDFSTKIFPTFFAQNTPTAIFIEQKNNISEGQIFDISGKIHTQFSLEKGENRVNVQLESGVYFIKIGFENKRILVY
jgi:hypothetical protein